MSYIWNIAGLIVLIVCILLATSIGVVDIPFSQVPLIIGNQLGIVPDASVMPSFVEIIWELRLPRVLLAAFAGAGLALCGTVMQATVQNPLAEPYILGTASGASLGAVAAILFGSSAVFLGLGVSFWAFIGAIVATFIVLSLSGKDNSISAVRLVLAGAVVNALFGAIANFIVYIANDAEGMRNAAFWTMGSLASARWDVIWLPILSVSIIGTFFIFRIRHLNALLLGEEAAVTLGINLKTQRRLNLILTALLTGIIVSVCGVFGFVGLIIPHIIRMLWGSDHRILLPRSLILGAIFLIFADVLSRILLPSGDLPIGILTAIIGAPLFMHLLFRTDSGLGK